MVRIRHESSARSGKREGIGHKRVYRRTCGPGRTSRVFRYSRVLL